MERISTFQATLLAWKSIECWIEPLFTSVISKVSPTLPRRIGPGTESPKVHILWSTSGAIHRSFSVASSVMRCTVPVATTARWGRAP